MEFKLCNTCEHFVDCAWFCTSKNRFIFDNPPEECDKYEVRTEKSIYLNRKRRI